MSWTTTLILTGLTTGLVVFCGWRGARAPNLVRGPRMIPYRLIMLLGSAVLLMLIVHMVNLGGTVTGNARY